MSKTFEEMRYDVAKEVLASLMSHHRTPIDVSKGGSLPSAEKRASVLFPDTAARLSVEYADELLKALKAVKALPVGS